MNRLILSIALVTTLVACGGDAESREDLEGQATSRTPAVEAARVTPAAEVRAIPAGTLLTFRVGETLSTSTHSSGDAFSLVLVDGVSGRAGATLTAGSPARGLITNAHRSSGPDDQALLAVRVASVETGGAQRVFEGQVESVNIESSARDSGARTAATIATGAAAGAIIGQILGQDTRATVAGAAVGTAVGVGVALTTRDGDATLPAGSLIVIRLDRDLVF